MVQDFGPFFMTKLYQLLAGTVQCALNQMGWDGFENLAHNHRPIYTSLAGMVQYIPNQVIWDSSENLVHNHIELYILPLLKP